MKLLTDLRPQWIGALRPDSGEGITFDCPTCPNHRLAAYFTNPRDGGKAMPGSSNWTRDGDDFAALTITPSIHYPCWHGWVEKGRVFDTSESPLVIFGDPGTGRPSPIALSPEQARQCAEAVLQRVAALNE